MGDEATARIIESEIEKNNNAIVFTLGDNAYPDGETEQFLKYYEPSWGRFKSRTKPVPGNHDWLVQNAADYLDYFCPSAENCVFPNGVQSLYYSYDIGSWHILALDSQQSLANNSTQLNWVQSDLAQHSRACTLVYWHKPRFGSSPGRGDSEMLLPLWRVLYRNGVDIVLNGHDHHYERFYPQDPNGNFNSRNGIRQFIVGAGGAGIHDFGTPSRQSAVRLKSLGVLKLTLGNGNYDWKFLPVVHYSSGDSGSASCVNAAPLPNKKNLTVSRGENAGGFLLSADKIIRSALSVFYTAMLPVHVIER
jgi:hypothetical protein